MNVTETIVKTLETLRTDLADKQAARDGFALTLIERPGAEDVADALQATDAEIVLVAGRIELFEAALRASLSRDESAASANKINLAIEAGQRAIEASKLRVSVAKKIDASLATLGDLIDRWNAVSDEAAADVAKVIKLTTPTLEAQLDRSLVVRSSVQGENLAQPLGQALLANGVAGMGGNIYALSISFTTRPGLNCESMASENLADLESRLDGVLREAQL